MVHVFRFARECLKFSDFNNRTLLSEPRHEISNNVVCATSKASD